jgi:hypothetical protein
MSKDLEGFWGWLTIIKIKATQLRLLSIVMEYQGKA